MIQCDDSQVSYTSTNENGDDINDGLCSEDTEDVIMDHIIFWDSMTLHRCSLSTPYWSISYYHIINPILDLCGTIYWSNPI